MDMESSGLGAAQVHIPSGWTRCLRTMTRVCPGQVPSVSWRISRAIRDIPRSPAVPASARGVPDAPRRRLSSASS
jgi:hypothetical protein